jgi:subtilase family serine protease
LSKLYADRKISVIVLAALILIISFPGIAATAKAETTPNNWTAQTLFEARPASIRGLDPYSPSQIKAAYDLPTTGALGSGETIAIVDAYNDPTIASDLATFDNEWSLTGPPSFTEHEIGSPSTNSGWALEISLDVEWAHAIAPDANILLVEATSNSLANLMSAIQYAATYPGVVAVSMSWGGSEFSTEATSDSVFTSTSNNPGVVFFAASGDTGGTVIWPSASPDVVSVGGTTLNLVTSSTEVTTVSSETAWSDGGGGLSAYESAPAYQTSYGLTYAHRATPDVSYDANPSTGVYVYDSTPYEGESGWWEVGGTSVGTPQWAAIQALGLTANDNNLYQVATTTSTYSTDFRDIVSGSNGYPAEPGYDLATGLGSPLTATFTPVPSTPPSFSLSASPSALTIKAGSSGSSTLTAASINGYSGTVALTVTAPTGWTTSLSSGSISVPPSSASTLTVTVPSTAKAGTYTIAVEGIASGLAPHTATITVTVTTARSHDR